MNDRRWLHELRALPISAMADARDGRDVFPQAIRAQGGDWTMAGPAYTVELPPGDNLGVHHAISKAPPGSVVVALCRGERGVWDLGGDHVSDCQGCWFSGICDQLVRAG
jgi:4-hydroxy-4-methyl-2-oxoglutarate aldolase